MISDSFHPNPVTGYRIHVGGLVSIVSAGVTVGVGTGSVIAGIGASALTSGLLKVFTGVAMEMTAQLQRTLRPTDPTSSTVDVSPPRDPS